MTDRQLGSHAGFAAALLDPGLPCPIEMVTWNHSDPASRLAVHRNNIVSSLVDALAETFPVAQELVGVEFFRAMASVFVRQSPPRSCILAHYGQDFPDFMDRFEPACSVPYLADVGRLEAARVRAYHARDGKPPAMEVIGMAMASGDRIGELHFTFQPSVSIVESRFAIASIWTTHQQSVAHQTTIDPDHPECVLVFRDALDVLVLKMSSGAGEFVRALLRGHNLHQAVSAANQQTPEFELAPTLALLLRHGAVASLSLPKKLDT